MNRLGKVLHLSTSKNLILKTKIRAKTGTSVFNDQLNQIGRVLDVFGPVKEPYVSVKPIIDDPEKYVGCFLYVMSFEENLT